MTERRWFADPDEPFLCDNIWYRVRTGRKWEGDLVLDQRVNGQWMPVHMESGFLRADFFFENEEVGFPAWRGNLGGQMYLDACGEAVGIGWMEAARKLDREKRRARERRRAS